MCYKEQVQRAMAERFEQQLDAEGVPDFIRRFFVNFDSVNTQINYWSTIKDLLQWAIDKGIIKKGSIADLEPCDMEEIESEDIRIYLKEKEREGAKQSSLGVKKNRFSRFWTYLKGTKRVPVKTNIVKNVKYRVENSRDNVYLKMPSDQELEEMMKNISKKKDPFIRDRNLIILRFLKGTGLREAELAGLDDTDVHLDGVNDPESRPYIMVLGKGHYTRDGMRKVLLTKDAYDALNEWFAIRDRMKVEKDAHAVFLNKNGNRLNEDNIKGIFKTYSGTVTPHMIRHWYATVFGKKYGIAFVQQQLGHKKADITIGTYTDGSYGINLMI